MTFQYICGRVAKYRNNIIVLWERYPRFIRTLSLLGRKLVLAGNWLITISIGAKNLHLFSRISAIVQFLIVKKHFNPLKRFI